MRKRPIYILFLFLALAILWGGFPGAVEENVIDINAQSAGKIFAGRIASVIPMATCSNSYTSSACINCNTGSWDDITISTVFGGSDVTTYACKMATFMPHGMGTCQMSEVIFGPGAANQLSANDGTATNIWCQMQ